MEKKKEKKGPAIVGRTPSQMNGPYWRKKTDNVTTELLKLPKSKAVSYLKVHRRSRGGSKLDIQFWKTLANGYMIYVDVTNCKVGIIQGLGGNTMFDGSTKK